MSSRFLFSLFAALLLFASCSKSDSINRCVTVTTIAPDSEVKALQAILTAQSKSATADPRGFFYAIDRLGDTTKRPSVCSSVKVSYTLRYLNGMQIEAGNNVSFVLGNLVLGWQEGVPLIGKGGYITLYLPPSLAYGVAGSSTIPANTSLAFQIDVEDVQ